jgi:hypothetical protein
VEETGEEVVDVDEEVAELNDSRLGFVFGL